MSKLVDAGNSLDIVSKFMGHKSTETTSKHYWTVSVQELNDKMKNPFAGRFQERHDAMEAEREELQLANTKTRKRLEIINRYNVVIGAVAKKNGLASEVQDAILDTLPGLEGLLKLLNASVGGCDAETERSESEGDGPAPPPAKRIRT